METEKKAEEFFWRELHKVSGFLMANKRKLTAAFLGFTLASIALSLFCGVKIEGIVGTKEGCLFSFNATDGFYSCGARVYIFSLGGLYDLQVIHAVSFATAILFAVLTLISFSAVEWSFLRGRSLFHIADVKIVAPLMSAFPILRENWGAPFIGAFIVALLLCAILLSLGNVVLADALGNYSFLLLVLGVALMAISALRRSRVV